MVYSDHYTKVLDEEETAKFQASLGEDASEQEKSLRVSKLEKHPVIDYQQGSLRDDFDFGSLWLIKAQALRDYVAQRDRQEYLYAGLYDLRLYLSRVGEIFHINEYLYTETERDNRKSGEKQFDYVNPRNREVQIEMEKACTQHLGKLGALIDTCYYRQPNFDEQDFEYEASVIIPVFNREKTIADAVFSAMQQKTNFNFNVIVVDNHSTDRTGEIVQKIADSANKDVEKLDLEYKEGKVKYTMQEKLAPRLFLLQPASKDLGIGGCWNLAISSEFCGKFAVQLDSDDLLFFYRYTAEDSRCFPSAEGCDDCGFLSYVQLRSADPSSWTYRP